MNNHEQNRAQFPPLIVDAQIDELLRSRRQRKGSPAADEQLVRDLHVLYEAASAGTQERVWQRLVDHVASDDAESAPYEPGVGERNFPPERHHHMRNETLSPFARKQIYAQRSGVVGIVAAVILTALLVGSMAWIMALEHYHNTGSDMGSANGDQQQQQTSALANYSGIYVLAVNSVQRVDAKTGKMIWRYEMPFIPSPSNKNLSQVSAWQFIVAGDTVYTLLAGRGDKNPTTLIALQADTGKERWSQPLIDQSSIVPFYMALDDGMIYVEAQAEQAASQNGGINYNIYSFSAKDGKPGSTYAVPGNSFPSTMTVLKGILYIPTDKGLYAMDAGSKKLLWSNTINVQSGGQGQTIIIMQPYICNGVLYAALVSDKEGMAGRSRVAAFNLGSGKLIWQSEVFAGEASKLTIAHGVMYVGSSIANTGPLEGMLYAYNATDGRQIWKIATNGGVQNTPSISNGVVYVPLFTDFKLKESILAVDLKTGQKKWQHQIDEGLTTTPYEQDGVVYIAAGLDKGTLYALNASDGSQKWTLDIGAGPKDITIVA